MNDAAPLTQKRIFAFWWPLAMTWLMMSLEGPFIAAVIARLPGPKFNLAAYGVAFAFAMLVESPIILIMSASTALVHDRLSLHKLRRFTYALNLGITLAMGLLVFTPAFGWLMEGLIGLPHEVAALTHKATIILLPWPAAIGYRRFYQGILIRSGLTRRVAYGTVVRLSSMGTVALVGAFTPGVVGAVAGASALSAGVVMEALASRVMALGAVRKLMDTAPPCGTREEAMTYGFIWRFYYPLALTSILTLGVNPVVTFFLGQSRMALESLAAMPVVNSLVFLFGSVGFAFQEVGIALIGARREGYLPLRRFATIMAVSASGGLALVAFTPLLRLWLEGISGLTPELAAVAAVPIRILSVMPALAVIISFQRAVLVAAKDTVPITWATVIEVTGIVVGLELGIRGFYLVGATAAGCAFILGRIAAIFFLASKGRL
jgi:Na+-driven multidrug efflux pump